MRASLRTSSFWSSRSWKSSGIAADFSCWTSSQFGIDRHALHVRIGQLVCRNLADNVAQRGFDRGPVIFLRRRQLQTVPDARDLHVGEQRIGFLRLRLGDDLRLGRDFDGRIFLQRPEPRSHSPSASGNRMAWQRQTPGAAARSARGSARACRREPGPGRWRPRLAPASEPDGRPWRRGWLQAAWGGACVIISALTLGTLSRPRMAVVAAPRTRKQVSTTMVMAFDKRLSATGFKST